MPQYESEEVSRSQLETIRKRNHCTVCGGWLNMFYDPETKRAFVACADWPRTHHEGIEREAGRYEIEGLAALNIPRQNEIFEKEYGMETTKALATLPRSGALTQPQAMKILQLVYPNVPEPEIIRTAILCRDFGLHPLMKEVYIIGYKNKSGGVDYSTVVGIAANRKMAAAVKGAFSFLENTPRAARPEEITEQFGPNSEEVQGNLISICKLKGEKGNQVIGFGLYPKSDKPMGMGKGNTQRNMANIRAERQALDRLPGEAMPLRGVEVIDEAYTEVPDIGKVAVGTGEIIEGEALSIGGSTPVGYEMVDSESTVTNEHWCDEHQCAYELKQGRYGPFYAHKTDGGWCNEGKKSAKQASKQEAVPDEEPEAPSEPVKSTSAPARDPDGIKTYNDLCVACNADYKMQPPDILKDLGVKSKLDISDFADAYRQIAAVRK